MISPAPRSSSGCFEGLGGTRRYFDHLYPLTKIWSDIGVRGYPYQDSVRRWRTERARLTWIILFPLTPEKPNPTTQTHADTYLIPSDTAQRTSTNLNQPSLATIPNLRLQRSQWITKCQRSGTRRSQWTIKCQRSGTIRMVPNQLALYVPDTKRIGVSNPHKSGPSGTPDMTEDLCRCY